MWGDPTPVEARVHHTGILWADGVRSTSGTPVIDVARRAGYRCGAGGAGGAVGSFGTHTHWYGSDTPSPFNT